jgi:hypothetical protein
VEGNVIKNVSAGKTYKVLVEVPRAKKTGTNGMMSNGTKTKAGSIDASARNGKTNGVGANGAK